MQAETRSRLHAATFRLYSEPGCQRVTVRELAKAGGVPSSALYHWYGDIDTLLRLAVAEQIGAMREALEWRPEAILPVEGMLLAYAGTCADLFGSDAYRRLLYLVVRDGAARPWLVRKHRTDLLELVPTTLERLVARSGRARGAQLAIRASAARAFADRLHAGLALPMLVPGARQPTRQAVRALTQAVAAAAHDAVYATNLVVDQLMHLPVGRLPPPSFSGGRPAARPTGPLLQ